MNRDKTKHPTKRRLKLPSMVHGPLEKKNNQTPFPVPVVEKKMVTDVPVTLATIFEAMNGGCHPFPKLAGTVMLLLVLV